VDIDETWRDGDAFRVDLRRPTLGDAFADCHDSTTGNRNVRFSRGGARAVDDVSVANHEVVRRMRSEDDRWRADQSGNGTGGAGEEIASRSQGSGSVKRYRPNVTRSRT
jgi:hypothetical protein